MPQSVVDKFNDGQPYITVHKDGYGQNFGKISATVQKTIVLPNDAHPIEGTLIDPEGNPVVGATVKVERYTQFAPGVLGKAIREALEKKQAVQDLPQGMLSSLDHLKPVTTDAEGKYTIRGVGAERVAYLSITGKQTALRKIAVATTDQPTVKF